MPRETYMRPIAAGQSVAIGGTSTQSTNAISTSETSTAVRLVATVDCWVSIGANPTAAAAGAASFFLPANNPEYFSAKPTDKVAVIQASSSGSLYMTPMIGVDL